MATYIIFFLATRVLLGDATPALFVAVFAFLAMLPYVFLSNLFGRITGKDLIKTVALVLGISWLFGGEDCDV